MVVDLTNAVCVCVQCGLIDLGLTNGKLNCEGQTVAGNSSEGAPSRTAGKPQHASTTPMLPAAPHVTFAVSAHY